jgi:tetratricopeptide (TPR) repeat protein
MSFDKGEHDQAIANYTEAIRLNPNDAIAYFKRGECYNLKGERDRAIADFSQAIRLKPDYVKAYVDRGASYGEKGYHDRALADCEKAIAIDPHHWNAYNNRLIAKKMLREPEELTEEAANSKVRYLEEQLSKAERDSKATPEDLARLKRDVAKANWDYAEIISRSPFGPGIMTVFDYWRRAGILWRDVGDDTAAAAAFEKMSEVLDI